MTSAGGMTAKQRAFVEWYCSAEVNMNGREAARRAGYKGSNATLRVVASENLAKPNIRREVDRRIDAALAGAGITIEKILNDIGAIKVVAMEAKHWSAAIRCLVLQGKYLGMFTDKVKLSPSISEISNDELVALIRELLKSGDPKILEVLDDFR